MLFHTVEPAARTAAEAGNNTQGVVQIEMAASVKKKAKVSKPAILWASAIIGLFVAASFLAHALDFVAGETVFLNLTVAVTSALAGAFVGERLVVNQLTV
jgi:hypothetical protein